LHRRGEFAENHALHQVALAIYTDLGRLGGLAWSNLGMVRGNVHQGQYATARALFHVGLPQARESGVQRAVGNYLFELACVALAGQAYAEAEGLLEESLAVYREITQPEDLGSTLAVLGVTLRGLGKPREAKQRLYEALQTAVEIEAFLPLMYILPATTLLLIDQSENERAVELYTMASRYGFVANSRWFEDIAGKHIAAVAATLPPEVVTAAQERGRARDLWVAVKELLKELGD
jgi:tetratricopeptide (TPR) repeat protein